MQLGNRRDKSHPDIPISRIPRTRLLMIDKLCRRWKRGRTKGR